MNLRYPVELLMQNDLKKSLLTTWIDINIAKKHLANQNPVIAKYKNGKCYLLNPFDDLDQLTSHLEDYQFYYNPNIYQHIENESIKISIDASAEDELIGFKSGIIWRMASSTIAEKINVDSNYGLRDILNNPLNVWNITAQIGFPLIFNLAAGIIRAINALHSFEKKHHRPITDIERQAIYKDCAAYSAQGVIGAGACELGFFIGQCLITICSLSPVSAWIPATLSLSCGLLRGIFSVVNQVADEKRKYGEVRSPYKELRDIFFNGFVNGALAVTIGYHVNFMSLAAAFTIAPIVKITASFLAVAVNRLATAIVEHIVPAVLNHTEIVWGGMSSFFKDNPTSSIELQPLKMKEEQSTPFFKTKK